MIFHELGAPRRLVLRARACRVFLVHVRHSSLADLYHFAEHRFCRPSLKEGFVRPSTAVCILFVAFTTSGSKMGGWSDSADLGRTDRQEALLSCLESVVTAQRLRSTIAIIGKQCSLDQSEQQSLRNNALAPTRSAAAHARCRSGKRRSHQ